jgi:hypothetical protein
VDVRLPPIADIGVGRHAAAMINSLSTATNARVRDAVEAVYRTFAFPTPAIIEGCPCCLSTRGVDVLLTTPLRELSGQELWRYVSGAFLTVGSELDFRYLLPRILDISVKDPANAIDPEIVLGKLPLATWRSWSRTEQGVIEEFVDAWFEWALARDLAEADDGWVDMEAERVLCGAARAGLPLERWLLRLQEPVAAPVLADLKRRFPGQLSAFWEDTPEGFGELSTVLSQGRA